MSEDTLLQGMGRSGLIFITGVIACAGFLSGCSSVPRRLPIEPLHALRSEPGAVLNAIEMGPDLEESILALDPQRLTERDVREVLARAPAPRVMSIQGGAYPAFLLMESFSSFLMGMGYPEARLRNPATGGFSYNSYRPATEIAGAVAWFYEKEGLRPMIVGHSQGGMQTVKVLHVLGGRFAKRVRAWDPRLRKREDRFTITDPLTGGRVPVAGAGEPLVSFASATGAGGLARLSPTQIRMWLHLRQIPDSVEAFTGYSMALDLLGADLAGFGRINDFHADGEAHVRNVRLPAGYGHISVPRTRHLVEGDPAIRDWINHRYRPSSHPRIEEDAFATSSENILWAADIWHDIRKHWCLELQRLVRAKREARGSRRTGRP